MCKKYVVLLHNQNVIILDYCAPTLRYYIVRSNSQSQNNNSGDPTHTIEIGIVPSYLIQHVQLIHSSLTSYSVVRLTTNCWCYYIKHLIKFTMSKITRFFQYCTTYMCICSTQLCKSKNKYSCRFDCCHYVILSNVLTT